MADDVVQNVPDAVVTANPPDAAAMVPPQATLGVPSASWLFIPVLYVMQGMAVTTVQELFPITLSDLKVATPTIVFWISIVSLPWTLKLLWAPLVDLNSTKRRWTLVMEVLIALLFAALAGCVLLPQFIGGAARLGFVLTLVALSLMAIFSSTQDIACDGLYILALDDEKRSEYVGWQSGCYRLGRMLCLGALVALAGELIELKYSPAVSWMAVLLIALVIYGGGTIWNFFVLPKPAVDRPAAQVRPGESRRDIIRTLLVLAVGLGMYLFLSGGIRLSGGGVFLLVNQHRDSAHWILAAWHLSPSEMLQQVLIAAIGAMTFGVSAAMVRPVVGGTPMAEAFMSFVRQDRFWAIMLFILFYRFGEAMVTRVATLFFKDPIAHGGLGVSTKALGGIVGVAGPVGIVLGGVVGGILVSRWGLRKAFWPLALAMYLPNLFYLFIASSHQQFANPHGWPNALFHYWILYVAAFIHEFGYGIGFATYCLFLMNISQRGNFKAAHYAFGTGLGALCITLAGIVSAILLTVVGYVGFFIAVCALSIPGLLTLLVVPMEE